MFLGQKKKKSPFAFSSDSIVAVTSQEWVAESQSAASQLMLCVQNLFSGIQLELLGRVSKWPTLGGLACPEGEASSSQ